LLGGRARRDPIHCCRSLENPAPAFTTRESKGPWGGVDRGQGEGTGRMFWKGWKERTEAAGVSGPKRWGTGGMGRPPEKNNFSGLLLGGLMKVGLLN